MPETKTAIITSSRQWFLRGFFAAALFAGALNAMSYFFRSDSLGNLVGAHPERNEAIGFPWQLWQRGNAYNGFFVDYSAVGANVLTAAAMGVALGAPCFLLASWLNRISTRLEKEVQAAERRAERQMQFSIRSMLVATAVAAVVAWLWRSSMTGSPEALGAIYLFGPVVLCGVALAPRNVPWQQRVIMLVPLTLMLIGAAIGIGARLPNPLDFDQVLLGVFVCWTPQCALSALALTATIFAYEAVAFHFFTAAPDDASQGNCPV